LAAVFELLFLQETMGISSTMASESAGMIFFIG
jgi:hypothetical protein